MDAPKEQSHKLTVDEARQMAHNAVLAALTTNDDFHYVEDVDDSIMFVLYDESGEDEVHAFVTVELG